MQVRPEGNSSVSDMVIVSECFGLLFLQTLLNSTETKARYIFDWVQKVIKMVTVIEAL